MIKTNDFKIAWIGGGSIFLPSIINGIADCMKQGAFDVQLALYDLHAERAERIKKYADIVSNAPLPLKAGVAKSRGAALAGADLVVVSVSLDDKIKELEQSLREANAHLPKCGPRIATAALAVAPFFADLAREIKQYCPDALLVSLVNPTDILPLYLQTKGVQTVGMCVEVEGLRGALAYYLRVPEESVALTCAGVNHDGWTLKLLINGENGYDLLRKKLPEIQKDPDFHPDTYGALRIFELTGYLRSSAYHPWPFAFESRPDDHAWQGLDAKRENYENALQEALRTGKPITDRALIHPEKSLVNYPGTGRALGRLIKAMATGNPETITLQAVNNGAISNFPAEVGVEAPALVKGRQIVLEKVGDLPEWLGGITRLLAIQRRIIADYLVNPTPGLLRQALSVLPIFTPVEHYLRAAQTLHEIYLRLKISK